MKHIKFILYFIGLACVTLVCHIAVDHYERDGDQMLTGQWQFSSPQNIKIADKYLELFSDNGKRSVAVYQDIKNVKPGDILLLSADISCIDVVPGKRSWNRARLLLVQNDGTKNRYDHPHELAALSGSSRGWKHFSKIFFIAQDTEYTRIVAQLSRATGLLRIKNIMLCPARQNPVYAPVQYTIIACWAIFGLMLLSQIFTGPGRAISLKIPLTIAFILIITGTTMPGSMRTGISQNIAANIAIARGSSGTATAVNISKYGHFIFFLFFGSLLYCLTREDPLVHVILTIVMLAGGTEMIQFFIDGRTPLFTDFFIDLSGGVCGLILSALLSKPYDIHDI